MTSNRTGSPTFDLFDEMLVLRIAGIRNPVGNCGPVAAACGKAITHAEHRKIADIAHQRSLMKIYLAMKISDGLYI